ncbi:MAG: hypothetical protein E3J91_01460 [Hadesarchaea archaeon]|nr:MAG: hypothetical protein E3J91_01460 [Hadesarchaea archaeon]
MAEDLVTIFLIGILGVVVGGIITFAVQRNLQEREWRKKRAEEIYAPLLDQLSDIEANLYKLTKDPSYPEWSRMREKHLVHFIEPKLKDRLLTLFIELHNFNIYLRVAINRIKEPMKKEILQRLKEEHKDEVQRSTPFLDEAFFWDGFAKLVLKKEDSGGFFGFIHDAPLLEKEYGELEKHFETRYPFDDFIKDFASKIKDDPFFRDGDFKRELRDLVAKTQELKGEVEKKLGIFKKEEWD